MRQTTGAGGARVAAATAMARASRTIDHDEIRQWVEARGGFPAHVESTAGDSDPGILRIDYPGFTGEHELQAMEWDAWFKAFDSNELAFLYQDEEDSRFSKLVKRRSDDEEAQADDADDRWRERTQRVTLNDATGEELDALYGIGQANASRIVAHRRRHGPFHNAEDLQRIDGIDGETARLVASQVSFE